MNKKANFLIFIMLMGGRKAFGTDKNYYIGAAGVGLLCGLAYIIKNFSGTDLKQSATDEYNKSENFLKEICEFYMISNNDGHMLYEKEFAKQSHDVQESTLNEMERKIEALEASHKKLTACVQLLNNANNNSYQSSINEGLSIIKKTEMMIEILNKFHKNWKINLLKVIIKEGDTFLDSFNLPNDFDPKTHEHLLKKVIYPKFSSPENSFAYSTCVEKAQKLRDNLKNKYNHHDENNPFYHQVHILLNQMGKLIKHITNTEIYEKEQKERVLNEAIRNQNQTIYLEKEKLDIQNKLIKQEEEKLSFEKERAKLLLNHKHCHATIDTLTQNIKCMEDEKKSLQKQIDKLKEYQLPHNNHVQLQQKILLLEAQNKKYDQQIQEATQNIHSLKQSLYYPPFNPAAYGKEVEKFFSDMKQKFAHPPAYSADLSK